MKKIKKISKKKKILALFINTLIVIMLPMIYSAANNTTYQLVVNNEYAVKENTEFNINIKSTSVEELTKTEMLTIKLYDKIELNETSLKEKNIDYNYDSVRNTLEIEGNNIKDMVEIPVKALASGETTIELYRDNEKIDSKTINIENKENIGIFPLAASVGDVHVPDSNLRKVINNELGRGFVDNSEYFTVSELESLYTIVYDSPSKSDQDKITDLTGLEYATNIMEMYLNHNNIKEITPLKNLTNLSSLDLSFNKIADISPLEATRDNVMWSTTAGQKVDLGEIFMQDGKIEIENPIKTNTQSIIEESIKDSFIASGATYDSTSDKFKWTGIVDGASIKVPFVWEDYNPYQLYFSGEVTFVAKEAIYIPDPNLRKAINSELGRGLVSTPEYFKVSELESLTKLYYASSTKTDAEKITDLTGLDYAINIKDLNLSYNKISDMIVISKITGLEKLILNNNQIVDISPIDKLVNLKSFAARNNQIVDISYLQNLSEITNINLGFNKVSNLAPIINLGKLTNIDFTSNNISDIEALKDITGLTSVSIGQNQISDITPLTNLINLTSLNLYKNKISNIDAIGNKSKLTYLVLSSNNIIDISPLKDIVSKITSLNATNQTINLGTHKIDGNSLSLDNPVITTSGKAPITTISNSGTYNSTNGTINWSNISSKQTLSFSFKDTTRMFDGTVSLSTEQTIYIPDPNLRKVINSELGRGLVTTPEYFTIEEMQSLTKLSYAAINKVDVDKIIDLTGLEYATNLTEINFSFNKISDLSPISKLTKLETLYMNSNQIANLPNDFDSLVSLKYLYMTSNQLVGLPDSFPNLPNLTTLYLHNNKITSLPSNFGDLKTLKTIYMYSNQLTSLPDSISDLTSLDLLSVHHNELTNLPNNIGNLSNLTKLYVNNNQITNLPDSLVYLTKLTMLDMGYNTIEEIGVLGSLSNLETLIAKNNNIYNANPLSSLEKLLLVDLDSNSISDLFWTYGNINLKELRLRSNDIDDISLFNGITTLETLYLDDNKIEDISKLSEFTNLIKLGLKLNNISDISPLTTLANLTNLDISENKISDISSLYGIITKITTFDGSNQNIDLGKVGIQAGNVSVKNDIKTIEGLVIPNTISNGGIYDVVNNNINWSNVQIGETLSFTFQDSKRNFSGKANLSIIESIYIPDPALRKSINEALGRGLVSTPEYFTKEELESLTYLSYSYTDEKIKDLTGLEYAINLYSVYFTEQEISNLEPLKDLKKLEELGLYRNQISNLEPLKNITSLKVLDMYYNQITDISPLSGLINLKVLGVGNNQITDISSVGGLLNLTSFQARSNTISDISSLKNLSELEGLSIENNEITDIGSLEELTKLASVNIRDNQIVDISPLKNNININQLYIDNNQVVDISVVSNFENLSTFDLSNNQVVDISPVANLQPLYRLIANRNRIIDISSLEDLFARVGSNSYYLQINNQRMEIGRVRINGNRLSIKNIVETVGGPVEPLTISDNGTYDNTNNTVNWTNIDFNQNSSFMFDDPDPDRNFSGEVSLEIERIGIKDPKNPDIENPNPNPEGIVDPNHDLELAINYIEPIDFGIVGIESRNMDIEAVTKTPYIQLTDLRETATGWKVNVNATKLKETNGSFIEGVRIRLRNGEVKSSPSGNLLEPTIINDIVIPLDNNSITNIMKAENTKGTGTWLGVWAGTGTTNEKVIMEVPQGKARVGTYETTLNWTLLDTP